MDQNKINEEIQNAVFALDAAKLENVLNNLRGTKREIYENLCKYNKVLNAINEANKINNTIFSDDQKRNISDNINICIQEISEIDNYLSTIKHILNSWK